MSCHPEFSSGSIRLESFAWFLKQVQDDTVKFAVFLWETQRSYYSIYRGGEQKHYAALLKGVIRCYNMGS
jgi:hypothetical protein